MPKNLRLVGALVALTAVLTSCSTALPDAAGSGRDTPHDRPVVLTTFTVLADMTRKVAGDHVVVESLTRVGAEIHGYEPTPGDLRRASAADLILDNGLNLEAWFERFVQDARVPHVVLSDGITPVDIAGDAYDGTPNPHAWMSPVVAQTYVHNIVAALSDLAPEHAADFARNGDAYRAELQAMHDELQSALGTIPRAQRALVTCEGAFSYLARDADLDERYIWPVNAEQQATPQQVAAVIEFVRERDVPAVFCESTVSDAAMRQVVEATGATFGGTLYVDSLSEPDGEVPTYLDLLRHDVDLIVAGLTGGTR